MNGFANRLGYSDVEPFEVVRVVSEKCVEVRKMAAELDPNWKPDIIPGGFAGRCVNQASQQWIIAPDLSRPVVKIRLRKNGQWYSACGSRFDLADKPVKFYDYNF
jgi:hypothetical protein